MNNNNTDVLIIGAGAIGMAVAYELSRYELSVTVVDRLNDVGGDASRSNSAIIHTGFDAPPSTLESSLVVHANPMFDRLCRELDIPFRRTGAVLVAVTEEEEEEIPEILDKAHENGVFDLYYLPARKVREMEPLITPKVRCGLYIPRESIIDPFLLVIAMAEIAVKNGVEFYRECEVKNIVYNGRSFTTETTKGKVKSKIVINAAGLNTDKISNFLGIDDFKVTPRRGQFHVIDRSAELPIRHIILPVPTKISKGKLITPTIHGNWLIGPTAEDLSDKSLSNTTRNGLDEIISDVKKLIPAIDKNYVITQYAGLRPVREPGGYHIRTFKNIPGFIELSGIRSTGITSSPAVAVFTCRKLKEMGIPLKHREAVCTVSTPLPIRKGIVMFRELNNLERAELIERDPLYGRIVCRCETVTESEVVQSIKRNPGAHDLDGIKRRVRAGLGRCQGGFCGMHIPKILARELNIPLNRVTKKGGGSFFLNGETKRFE